MKNTSDLDEDVAPQQKALGRDDKDAHGNGVRAKFCQRKAAINAAPFAYRKFQKGGACYQITRGAAYCKSEFSQTRGSRVTAKIAKVPRRTSQIPDPTHHIP